MFKKMLVLGSCIFTMTALANTTSVSVNANNESTYVLNCMDTVDSSTGTTAKVTNGCNLTNTAPGNSASPYIVFSSNTSTNPEGSFTLNITNIPGADEVPLCTVNVSMAEAQVNNVYSNAYCTVTVSGGAYLVSIHNGTTAENK